MIIGDDNPPNNALKNVNIRNNVFSIPSGGSAIEWYNGQYSGYNFNVTNNATSGANFGSVPAGVNLPAGQTGKTFSFVNAGIGDFHCNLMRRLRLKIENGVVNNHQLIGCIYGEPSSGIVSKRKRQRVAGVGVRGREIANDRPPQAVFGDRVAAQGDIRRSLIDVIDDDRDIERARQAAGIGRNDRHLMACG